MALFKKKDRASLPKDWTYEIVPFCRLRGCKIAFTYRAANGKSTEEVNTMRFLKYLLSTFGLARRSRLRRRTLERLRKEPSQVA